MPKNWRLIFFWFSVVGVAILALFFRLYQLGKIPVSLYWDEMAMYVDVKSILQSGQDMFGRPWYQVIFPSYGDFKLPLYIWSAAFSAKIFGLSAWSFRLPSVLAGVGTVLVAGFLARELLASSPKEKNLLQIITMLVVTITPWSILFSRTGFEGHLGQFFLAVSVLCFCLSAKHPRFIYLSPIFGAVATYAYFSVRFVWIVVFVGAVLLQPARRKKIWQIFVPLILYGLLLLPMLRSPLYQDANRFRLGTDSVLNQDYTIQTNVYRELAGNQRIDRLIFNRKLLMLQALFKNYAANLSANFLFVTGDPNLRHGTGQHGLFLLVMLPFFVYGLIRLFLQNKLTLIFLLLWWFAALLPAAIPNNVPHALRTLNALVPLSLMISYGVTNAFLAGSKSRFSPVIKVGGLAFFALIGIFAVAQFSAFYLRIYPQTSSADWQDGYQQIAQAMYAHRAKDQTVIVVPFDDRFYLWLMAYGPYTAADFHHWQSQKYQFFTSGEDNIFFTNIDDQTLIQKKSVVVIGKSKPVTEQLAKMKAQPSSLITISGISSQNQFVMAEFLSK